MSSEIDFIGRDREIKIIDGLLSEWMTSKVVYIEADGGIGKTRLLREIQKKAKKHKFHYQPQKEVTIALVQELTKSEWSREFVYGIREEAKSFGINLIETDAGFDFKKMAKDLDSVISQKPDAIIISLGTSELLRDGIKKAIKNDIKVITFDNFIENLSGITCRIEQDDVEAARLISKELANGINYSGKVAAFWTKGHAEQERRHKIFVDFLDRYPEVKIIDIQGIMGEGAEHNSYEKVKELLETHPDIKAIWAVFNEFARGATKALIETKRTDVVIYGFDCCPSDVKAMSLPNSPWVSTVAINPKEGGKVAIRITLSSIYEKEIKRNYLLPMQLVGKSSFTKDRDFYSSWDKTGFGWSDWLKSLRESATKSKPLSLHVSEISDFDDASLLVAENLELHISNSIRGNDYRNFLENLEELKEIEINGSFDAISKQKEKVTLALADAINQTKNTQKILLLFDTVEKLDKETRKRLIYLTTLLKNAVCIFAGRPQNTESFWKELIMHYGGSAKKIKLNALSKDESILYINKKQENAQVFLNPELSEKLRYLSNGRPIIIDLAVEFASQAISLDSLNAFTIKDFSQVSPKKRSSIIEKFESALVENILSLRHPLDRLVFTLSHVYPLTEDMICELLSVSQKESKYLYKLAADNVFVKVLPGDLGISLHDEMRRLIETYIWNKIDRDKIRRKRDSKIATNLYKNRFISMKSNIEAVKQNFEILNREKSNKTLLVGLEVESLERQYDFSVMMWAKHSFYYDPGKAFNELGIIVSKLRNEKKRELAFQMIEFSKKFRRELSEIQHHYLDYYYARALVDLNQLDNGINLLNKLLGKINGINDSAIYNTLGVACTKRGDYELAIQHQMKCLSLVDKNNKEAQAKILNQIGYNERLLGNYDQARKHYTDAQQLAGEYHKNLLSENDKKNNRALLASIGTNLAYTFWLKKDKDFSTAEHLCQDARDIYIAIQRYPEIAAPETTLAIMARDRGFYEDAANLLRSAISRILELARFRQLDYGLDLCRAYYHLGWTEWYIAEEKNSNESDITDIQWDINGLERSLRSFEMSKIYAERYNLLQELPGILHQTASVKWHLSRSTNNKKLQKEARELNILAIKKSNEVKDIRYAIDAILGDAEWDYEIGNYAMVEKHSALLHKNYGNFINKYNLYFGRMLRIEADIAFKRKNYKIAFKKYGDAFLLLNEHRGFGRYTITRELDRLARKIDLLPANQLENFLSSLHKHWEEIPNNQLLLSWVSRQLLHNRMRIAK